jgi:hypothetical protein
MHRDAGRDALALGKSHESKAYQGRRGDNGIQSLALRTNPKHFIVTFPKSPALLDKAPSKARILIKLSIASTSASKFGGERMIKARQGWLVRQSLEESALVGGHHG